MMRGGLPVTSEQEAIVDHVVGQRLTVVDAGAGSGKTYTTVATVLELLDKTPNATIDCFVLITFTRKAADELKQRLEKALRERQGSAKTPEERVRWAEARERLSSAYVGTIHGFCRALLREFGHGALVAREAEVEVSGSELLYEAIADTFEEQLQNGADHPLLGEMGRNYQSYHFETLIRDIHSDIRNRGLTPEEVETKTRQQPADAGKNARVAVAELVRQVHDAYSKKKNEAHQVDAADLLAKTAGMLEAAQKNEPGILQKVACQHRWLFVDEFQDTDRVQERIVEALLPHLEGVLLVGDVKQSIYGFRGAGLELKAIADRHKVDILPLNISRRPTKQLLALQNTLFKSVGSNYPKLNNPLQLPQTPIDSTSKLPPIGYVNAGVDEIASGARAAAKTIHKLLNKPVLIDRPEGKRLLEAGDIAILFRSNWALDEYLEKLNQHLKGKPVVRREEGGKFFQRPEIIAAYRLLRLVLDYPNEIALSQALRTPYLQNTNPSGPERKILETGRMTPQELKDWFEQSHRAIENHIKDLQAAVRSDTVPELVEKIFQRFAVRAYHEKRGERREVENLERLRERARELADSEQSLTARIFLRWFQTQLLNNFDEPEAGDLLEAAGARRPTYVRLMTVHKAKGLEFPIVIIPEVETPVVSSDPQQEMRFVISSDFGLDLDLYLGGASTQSSQFMARTRRDDTAQREEAMRVLYVAVTRAQNTVLFVGAGKPESPRRVEDKKYSWKDEIARAWPELKAQGALESDHSHD